MQISVRAPIQDSRRQSKMYSISSILQSEQGQPQRGKWQKHFNWS